MRQNSACGGVCTCPLLVKRIFILVQGSFRLVVCNVSNVEVLEDCVQCLSNVTECNCTVVWIVLADQNVAVEAAHFWDCKYTDTTE